MDWRDMAATQEFFKELNDQFSFNDLWYETSDHMVVQRLRGQRDVFEAIAAILGERGEE